MAGAVPHLRSTHAPKSSHRMQPQPLLTVRNSRLVAILSGAPLSRSLAENSKKVAAKWLAFALYPRRFRPHLTYQEWEASHEPNRFALIANRRFPYRPTPLVRLRA